MLNSSAELRQIIEKKSGASPVINDACGLRLKLGHDVVAMRSNGYDPSILSELEAFNEQLDTFIAHPRFGEYLATLTPRELYIASGVRVLPLDSIRDEIQQLAPGASIFPHGYMPFARSIGGNALCFHEASSRVIWAEHFTFSTDEIIYNDRNNGGMRILSFTADNIARAVVPLADDFETFLSELLHDQLGQKLDELD